VKGGTDFNAGEELKTGALGVCAFGNGEDNLGVIFLAGFFALAMIRRLSSARFPSDVRCSGCLTSVTIEFICELLGVKKSNAERELALIEGHLRRPIPKVPKLLQGWNSLRADRAASRKHRCESNCDVLS
jgi:hypothetical protein